MAKDLYNVNPLWLSPELTFDSEQNITEEVPVSHLGAYLEGTFGADVPTDRADRFAADSFFGAATTFSTDRSLIEILSDSDKSVPEIVKQYVPRWLQLIEPVVGATKLLDKAVDRHIAPYQDDEVSYWHDHDLNYLAGVFYIGTQLTSAALDIAHPSQLNETLTRRVLKPDAVIVGHSPTEPQPQTMLLALPIVKAEHVKKAEKLKDTATKLNAKAQRAAERIIAIAAGVEAKRELLDIIAQSSAD